MVTVFAVIVTNGTSAPETGSSIVVSEGREAATTSAPPSADPAPSISTAKADRKPPAGGPASPPPPNTGPESPKFRADQWIAVLDSYPTDTGMAADQVARGLAGKLIAAGVAAKAMLADGQYPGLAKSDLRPIRNTWLVYLGPYASAEAALDACADPKTQKVHANVACPTYEPATAPG